LTLDQKVIFPFGFGFWCIRAHKFPLLRLNGLFNRLSRRLGFSGQ
jgi:hypothetical protein